jgi:ATP-binding cassette subfamily B protein
MPILIVLNQIIPPLLASEVVNKLANGSFSQGSIWSDFGSLLVWFSVLTVLTSTLGWRLAIYLIWKLEIKVLRDLMDKSFAHLHSLDMDYHNNSFGGSLVSRVNKMAGAYIRLSDTFIFEIYLFIIVLIASGIVLAPLVPVFVLIFYGVIVLYIIVAILGTKKIRQLSAVEASKQNKITGFLADMVTNVQAVKSFAKGSFENKRFHEATTAAYDASRDVMRVQLARENTFSFIISLLSVSALVIATISVVSYGAEVGTVLLVLTYTTNITRRMLDFSLRALKNINKSLGDAEEAVEMLHTQTLIKDPPTPKNLPMDRGDIVFDSVSFSHDDNELFRELNLTVKSGQKIGLVGHSGSGKSTLTKLLLRFKDIDSGSIKINGVDLRETSKDTIRHAMAYVPQEPLLFHRSIKDNVLYGKPNATTKEVETACSHSNAREFIDKLEHGYDTLVGERGVKLSGGQKQRVAIARAMLKDAPILLLDEATSALDSESEQLIQDALWKLMEGKTAIVIAHRLSTIQKMDRIIVLDEGKIIEDGSHKDLLKKKGQYAKLWQHQSGGFLQD